MCKKNDLCGLHCMTCNHTNICAAYLETSSCPWSSILSIIKWLESLKSLTWTITSSIRSWWAWMSPSSVCNMKENSGRLGIEPLWMCTYQQQGLTTYAYVHDDEFLYSVLTLWLLRRLLTEMRSRPRSWDASCFSISEIQSSMSSTTCSNTWSSRASFNFWPFSDDLWVKQCHSKKQLISSCNQSLTFQAVLASCC